MLSKEKQAVAQNITLSVAMLLLLVTAAIPMFATGLSLTSLKMCKWLYALAAVLALAVRLTERYEGDNLRIRRLYRMAKVSAMLYVVSAFFVVYPLVSDAAAYDNRDWIAFLMAGAVMQIYVTFAVEHEQKKLKKASD